MFHGVFVGLEIYLCMESDLQLFPVIFYMTNIISSYYYPEHYREIVRRMQ